MLSMQTSSRPFRLFVLTYGPGGETVTANTRVCYSGSTPVYLRLQPLRGSEGNPRLNRSAPSLEQLGCSNRYCVSVNDYQRESRVRSL